MLLRHGGHLVPTYFIHKKRLDRAEKLCLALSRVFGINASVTLHTEPVVNQQNVVDVRLQMVRGCRTLYTIPTQFFHDEVEWPSIGFKSAF